MATLSAEVNKQALGAIAEGLRADEQTIIAAI